MPAGANDGIIPHGRPLAFGLYGFSGSCGSICSTYVITPTTESHVTFIAECRNEPHSETVTFESEGTRSHARKGWNVTGIVMSLTRSVGDCHPRSETRQSQSVEAKQTISILSLCTHNFQVCTIEKCLCDLSLFSILFRTFQELQDERSCYTSDATTLRLYGRRFTPCCRCCSSRIERPG